MPLPERVYDYLFPQFPIKDYVFFFLLLNFKETDDHVTRDIFLHRSSTLFPQILLEARVKGLHLYTMLLCK